MLPSVDRLGLGRAGALWSMVHSNVIRSGGEGVRGVEGVESVWRVQWPRRLVGVETADDVRWVWEGVVLVSWGGVGREGGGLFGL